MRNSEKTFAAVKQFIGMELTAKQIQGLTVEKFPDVNLGSVLPSDYSHGSKYSALQFLEKLGSGKYRVTEPVELATVRSTRKQSLTDAAASAHALLASQKPVEQQEVALQQAEQALENEKQAQYEEMDAAELEALTAPTE